MPQETPVRPSTGTMPGFTRNDYGLQVPEPHTNTYMIASIDAPVFDRRSSADREPKLPTDPLSAPFYSGMLLLKEALGEGRVI